MRFFCWSADPRDGGEADEGNSRARFTPPPPTPPPESTSLNSLHCFLIRSASNSSLLIRFREISFNASRTLRVGAASTSAVGAITRFSASISSSDCCCLTGFNSALGINNEPALNMLDRVFA
uniref:(northern house mosquito) hypothetical protein n=1 Tax=Culex pipiens TaxID=7175 RepID=A0A8D8DQX6_CULPI